MTMRPTLTLTIAAAAAALLLCQPAFACPPPLAPPPPYPNETTDAYAQRVTAWNNANKRAWDANALARQSDYWTRADTVVIARIDRIVLIRNDYLPINRATLTPVAWLKGAKLTGRFTLADTDATDCGAYGGGEATYGKPGDLVVVYATKGRLGNKTLIDSLAQATVLDPRVVRGFTLPR